MIKKQNTTIVCFVLIVTQLTEKIYPQPAKSCKMSSVLD